MTHVKTKGRRAYSASLKHEPSGLPLFVSCRARTGKANGQRIPAAPARCSLIIKPQKTLRPTRGAHAPLSSTTNPDVSRNHATCGPLARPGMVKRRKGFGVWTRGVRPFAVLGPETLSGSAAFKSSPLVWWVVF